MAIDYDSGFAIAQAVQDRAGISTDKISEKTRRYVLRSYYELLMLEPWPFALKETPGVINTVESFEDEITATEGSATATITTASTTTNCTGRKIYHNGNQKIYRITLHSAYTLTLDATWKEDSVSGETCTVYQDEYSIAADCVRLWSFRDRTNNIPIEWDGFIGMHRELDEKFYGSQIVHVSLMTETKVLFEPWLKDASTVEYLYTDQKDDLTFEAMDASDVPVVPKWHRHILEDMAYLKTLKDWEDRPSIQPKIVSVERDIARGVDRMRGAYIKNAESFSA